MTAPSNTDRDTGRRDTIRRALAAELERQALAPEGGTPRLSGRFGDHVLVISGEVDLEALAAAVEAAMLDGAPASVEEGRTPAELNAENDG